MIEERRSFCVAKGANEKRSNDVESLQNTNLRIYKDRLFRSCNMTAICNNYDLKSARSILEGWLDKNTKGRSHYKVVVCANTRTCFLAQI